MSPDRSSGGFFTRALRTLAHEPERHLPGLDVLRVIALLLVIAGHLRSAYLDHGGHESLLLKLPIARYGWMGADLFFVLSGYLIGRALFRELAVRGTIDVPRFLLRRGLRVWPLYYAAFLFVAFVLGQARLPFERWWSDVIFASNYIDRGVLKGGWSICLEEQFYLIAPIALAVTAAHARAHRPVLLATLALFPLLRAATWWKLTGSLTAHDADLFVNRLFPPIHLHGDGIVVGLVLANTDEADHARFASSFWSSAWAIVAAAVACVGLMAVQRDLLGFTGLALLFGAITARVVGRARTPSFRGAVVWRVLARLSFGMYLNHRYVLEWGMVHYVRHVPLGDRAPGVHAAMAFVAVTALSAIVALISFGLVEHPFLELRRSRLGSAYARA